MSAQRIRPTPTSRQLNEADRLASRYGKMRWAMRSDGAMVVRCDGDSPALGEPPLIVTLDPLGRALSASGQVRRSADD